MLVLSNHVFLWYLFSRIVLCSILNVVLLQMDSNFESDRLKIRQASMPALVLCEVHGDSVQDACEGWQFVSVSMP
jgi:hypothetical protein